MRKGAEDSLFTVTQHGLARGDLFSNTDKVPHPHCYRWLHFPSQSLWGMGHSLFGDEKSQFLQFQGQVYSESPGLSLSSYLSSLVFLLWHYLPDNVPCHSEVNEAK